MRVRFEGEVENLRLSPELPARGRPLREVYPQYDLATSFTGQLGRVRFGFMPTTAADQDET